MEEIFWHYPNIFLSLWGPQSWVRTGDWWTDAKCHLPGGPGGEVPGADEALPLGAVLPVHPSSEEYGGQARPEAA